MACIMRFFGLVFILSGSVLISLDLATGGRFFLNYAVILSVATDMPRWFGIVVWVMPVYCGFILLLGVDLEERYRRMRR